jgi:hypothetical protein
MNKTNKTGEREAKLGGGVSKLLGCRITLVYLSYAQVLCKLSPSDTPLEFARARGG